MRTFPGSFQTPSHPRYSAHTKKKQKNDFSSSCLCLVITRKNRYPHHHHRIASSHTRQSPIRLVVVISSASYVMHRFSLVILLVKQVSRLIIYYFVITSFSNPTSASSAFISNGLLSILPGIFPPEFIHGTPTSRAPMTRIFFPVQPHQSIPSSFIQKHL